MTVKYIVICGDGMADEPLEAILGPNKHGGARHLFDRAKLLNRHV